MNYIAPMAISPEAAFDVVAGGESDFFPTLKVWDTQTGRERFTLRGHDGAGFWIESCAISPDSSFIVAGYYDGVLQVWDTHTGQVRTTLQGHTSGVVSCVVSPDNSFSVSGSSDGTLKIWDARSDQEQITSDPETTRWIDTCATRPSGPFV